MSSEWPIYNLDDCLDALIDYRGKTPEKTSKGIPLVTAKVIKGGRIETPTEFIAEEDYETWMRRGIPKAGDVVMTTEAPLGEVAQLGSEKVALAQRVITLRGKAGLLDSTYLLYLLQTQAMQEQLKARSTGTTVIGIKQSELRKVQLCLPPIDVQTNAASVLSLLDKQINLLRETNSTLEAIAQALFKSWFVDFDPVRAKQEGREPEGIDAETAALFPEEFEESAIGLIPKGWRLSNLAEIMSIQGGTQPPASEFKDSYEEGYVRLLQIRDFSNDNHITYIPATTKLRLVKRDDVLIGRYGSGSGDRAKDSLGRLLRGLEGAINVAIVKAIPSKTFYREWIAHYVGSGRFYDAIVGGSSRAVQAGFRQEDLNFVKIPVAPDEVFMAFHDVAMPIWEKTLHGFAQMQSTMALRDMLLPRLITGQLRLPEVEEQFGEVLTGT